MHCFSVCFYVNPVEIPEYALIFRTTSLWYNLPLKILVDILSKYAFTVRRWKMLQH